MNWFLYIISTMAVWRVTHLIQAEDGPFDLIFKLRKLAGSTMIGSLMDCFYCLSIWVALLPAIYFGTTVAEKILLVPAFSAGAIFLNRIFQKEK
jgi:Protein of unknown function (DUF1360)